MNLTDDLYYKLLRVLEQDPNLSQRQLSEELGVSLGKVNFCIKALMKVGLVKVRNFKNSKDRASYLYLLTPKGVEEKTRVARLFLERKLAEAEIIQNEIMAVKNDLHKSSLGKE